MSSSSSFVVFGSSARSCPVRPPSVFLSSLPVNLKATQPAHTRQASFHRPLAQRPIWPLVHQSACRWHPDCRRLSTLLTRPSLDNYRVDVGCCCRCSPTELSRIRTVGAANENSSTDRTPRLPGTGPGLDSPMDVYLLFRTNGRTIRVVDRSAAVSGKGNWESAPLEEQSGQ